MTEDPLDDIMVLDKELAERRQVANRAISRLKIVMPKKIALDPALGGLMDILHGGIRHLRDKTHEAFV